MEWITSKEDQQWFRERIVWGVYLQPRVDIIVNLAQNVEHKD